MIKSRGSGEETRRKIVDYISRYTKENGYPPTFREIGVAVGLSSTSSVSGHMERLASDNVLTYVATKPRTIRLLEKENA